MKSKFKVTGATLKWFAIITMLIDHIGATAMYVWLDSYKQGSDMYQNVELMMNIMRYIGRMAFPIFCYLLVEGIMHTSNPKKYGIRLFVFALISDAPFCQAFSGEWPSLTSGHNVFFTLFIGFVGIEGCIYIQERIKNKVGCILSCIMVSMAAMIVAWFAQADYWIFGVFVIFMMYWTRIFLKEQSKELQFGVSVLPLIIMSPNEAFCLFDLLLIRNYDGTRGRQMKYFFYLFYPVHLAVLALLFSKAIY